MWARSLWLPVRTRRRVFLNGKLQSQPTQGGQLRIPNLELKDYVVRVSKSGFQDLPEQKIRIRKGEQAKLVFNLQPIPHLASLTIQGGVPGATVLIDQAPVGTVQPDGTLTVATINPGDHIVELRKDRFKPKQIKKTLRSGDSRLPDGGGCGIGRRAGRAENYLHSRRRAGDPRQSGRAPTRLAVAAR